MSWSSLDPILGGLLIGGLRCESRQLTIPNVVRVRRRSGHLRVSSVETSPADSPKPGELSIRLSQAPALAGGEPAELWRGFFVLCYCHALGLAKNPLWMFARVTAEIQIQPPERRTLAQTGIARACKDLRQVRLVNL